MELLRIRLTETSSSHSWLMSDSSSNSNIHVSLISLASTWRYGLGRVWCHVSKPHGEKVVSSCPDQKYHGMGSVLISRCEQEEGGR